MTAKSLSRNTTPGKSKSAEDRKCCVRKRFGKKMLHMQTNRKIHVVEFDVAFLNKCAVVYKTTTNENRPREGP